MIVAGVWTGVGFSNFKNCWTRIRPRFQNLEQERSRSLKKWLRPPLVTACDLYCVTSCRSVKHLLACRSRTLITTLGLLKLLTVKNIVYLGKFRVVGQNFVEW